jgi:flavin-dependent dehydrogenase
MAKYASLPVVVGSSMSGLLISDALSREGVEHYLIGGDRPPSIPRLGESMNECASPDLWRHYGRLYPEFFYPKNHISLLNGDVATIAHFGDPTQPFHETVEDFAHRPESFQPLSAKYLIHIDRVGFDQVLYDKVCGEPNCRFIHERIRTIVHDPDSDCVARIELENGEYIESPRYVFDTSGPRGIVAEAAGVGRESISIEQWVVWNHYRRESNSATAQSPWWYLGTNLLRLDRDTDGIDGISWLIPLGNTLSVGISIDSESDANARFSKEDVMRLLDAAYARRGMDYRCTFPDEVAIQDIRHRYFVRDRAYGGNWILVGGTFVQIWFPSSSGVWATTAVAGMVRTLLENPAFCGAQYESMMRGLLKFHGTLEAMIHGPVFRSRLDGYRFWARWLALIPKRVSDYIYISSQLKSRNPLFWGIRYFTTFISRFPRSVLVFGGVALIRCCRCTNPGDQAAAFPDYGNPGGFRFRNVVQGIPVAVNPALVASPDQVPAEQVTQ